MSRNRPGKRERLNAKRDAFQRERASIMARNAMEPKPERPIYGAPKGLRNSVLARDSLKSASHDIGFVGPRGYHTPSDAVSRNETVKPSRKEVRLGSLASSRRSAQERQEALALAATVRLDRPTQKD